jgi:hypothetical protein
MLDETWVRQFGRFLYKNGRFARVDPRAFPYTPVYWLNSPIKEFGLIAVSAASTFGPFTATTVRRDRKSKAFAIRLCVRGLEPIEQTAQFGNDLGWTIFLPESNNRARRGALPIVTRLEYTESGIDSSSGTAMGKSQTSSAGSNHRMVAPIQPSESCTSGRQSWTVAAALRRTKLLESGATPSSLTGLRRRSALARRRRGGPPEGRRTISAGRFRCRAAHTASSRAGILFVPKLNS